MGDLVDSEDNEGGEGGLCGPRLAPDRDCARSAACHGGLWGVRGRQLRAFGAPQSVVKISRILRLLCGERNGCLALRSCGKYRASCALVSVRQHRMVCWEKAHSCARLR